MFRDNNLQPMDTQLVLLYIQQFIYLSLLPKIDIDCLNFCREL